MLRAILSLFSLLLAASTLLAKDVRFNRDIRPILSENCFLCHGPDKNTRMAGLRLDVRENALEAGAIVAGDPESSKLVARIHQENEALRMPPVWSDKELTSDQKQTLIRWIEQGAEYQRHWAYIPPKRPEAPEGPAAIDYLVNRKLEEEGLEPVGEADRNVLARRVSFDLTGLPPDIETVENFVRDEDPQAYRKLVDSYLASPHYGERMAVHWLDLVRYADTTGFHGDLPVDVYPFRDYVIRSFNENKPFDQFTREQLAGDLMPDATFPQKVASAYNRLGRMTNEGGAQAKEYLAKYAADRVRTLSTVWMASTVGCAECHDHKFDPFSTKDFYSLEAFFADVEEKGVFAGYADWGSKMRVPSQESRRKIAEIESKLKKLREQGKGELPPTPENLKKFTAYMHEELERWRVLEPVEARNDCSDPDIGQCETFEVLTGEGGFVYPKFGEGRKPNKIAQVVEAKPEAGRVTALLFEAFPGEECEEFFLGEIEILRIRPGAPARQVAIESFAVDWEGDGSWLRETVDGNHQSGWGGHPAEEGTRRAVFIFKKPLEVREGDRLTVTTIYDRLFGTRGLSYRQRLSVTDSDFPTVPPGEFTAKAVAADDWNEEQRAAVERLFKRRTELNSHWKEIRELERRKKTLIDHADETLVTKSVEPRTIRVLPRGNWMDDSGEIVEPQAPHFLEQIPANGRRLTRLDLANWLVDRDNPLTARAFVNRLWEMFFGKGLSKVLNDIGSQGEPPVNQELLDWLAVEFMESGWDVKHIVRTMLLSETYRRSSEPTEELRRADPFNRLHGRQSPIRLSAEFIRDNALAVSGLLNRKIGGPSVKPYQPPGHYKELNFPKREYEPDLNADQFRRGVYVHWQRTFLHPAMVAFDAPSREECAADRPVSNTPLQSLVLLNDPSFVEAAKAFAARILGSGEHMAARIDYAFQRAFSRKADPREKEVVSDLIERQRQHFREDPESAGELLSIGIWEAPEDLEKTELAAWTMAARALMNKHEFVMRY